MLTVSQVKEELPDVQVYVRRLKKTFLAKVSGRKNQFATVWVYDMPELSAEFAWETVANAFNNNSQLEI